MSKFECLHCGAEKELDLELFDGFEECFTCSCGAVYQISVTEVEQSKEDDQRDSYNEFHNGML